MKAASVSYEKIDKHDCQDYLLDLGSGTGESQPAIKDPIFSKAFNRLNQST